MTAPSLDIERVRRVFEQERDRGCTNNLVVGGLDRMLIQMSEDGLLSGAPELQQLVRRLPSGGYRSLEPGERRRWLEDVLGATAPRAPKSAPAGKDASGTVEGGQQQRRKPIEAESPVTDLPGINKGLAGKLAKLGVETVADAATLFPRRFNDFTDVRKIAELQPLPSAQTVVGTLYTVKQRRFGRRLAGSEAVLVDSSGSLKAVWFNQPYVAKALNTGDEVVLSGKVREYRGRLQMDNPEYEPYDRELMAPGRLVPVYPATQGLGQRTLRKVVRTALEAVGDRIPDPIPPDVRDEHRLPALREAVQRYHQPATYAQAEKARQRLALGEFVPIQAAVLQRRARWQQGDPAPQIQTGEWLPGMLGAAGFELTGAQDRVLHEIMGDIGADRPMLRLMQGDVGSGKTVVAFAAMLAAVASGYQAALMVPTEILAEQHYRALARLLGGDELSPLAGLFAPQWLGRNVRVMLLTGSLSASQKQQVRGDAAHQGVDIIIGTHALLEEGVELPRLALGVVDEQHRFGVEQRAKLRQKGLNPHLLVMTATPIPRTLALTVYGDLEVSSIDELPPGRVPVRTDWVKPHEREEAYDFIRERLDAGEQAFVICPLVEDSETVGARSAEEEFERLRTGPLRDYRLELLHGRMTGRHKDEVMHRFARGEIDVLVSTSVIEVGIDVPNATVIVIEGAERFGISQLHQFRGRVGRSHLQSYCLLFSTEEDPGPDTRERLEALVESNDGFKLAEVDLKMRGEGEAWGKVQAGANSMLRVARLTDRDILHRAREIADGVIAADPELKKPANRQLARAVAHFMENAAEAN